MTKLSASEQLLHCTVRLEASGPNGVSFGTGFFYTVHFGPDRAQLIITNKHVIQNCDSVKVTCHLADNNGQPSGSHIDVVIKLSSGGIVLHPDSDVDLCGFAFNVGDMEKNGPKLHFITIDNSHILPSKDWDKLDAYEEILMVGCPNGLFDKFNNYPIFRRGITSSHAAKRYNGKDEFLIDAACFPGSSGSPVFLFDTWGHLDKETGDYIIGHKRVNLLGILYAGPTITQNGQIVLAQQPSVQVSSMMHLGQVIRATRLFDLEREVKKLIKP